MFVAFGRFGKLPIVVSLNPLPAPLFLSPYLRDYNDIDVRHFVVFPWLPEAAFISDSCCFPSLVQTE